MFEVTRQAALAMSLLLPSAVTALGQSASPLDSPRLKSGMHVRVRSSAGDTVITGKLSFIQSDSLIVDPDSTGSMLVRPSLVAISRGDITRFEVERDEHTRDQVALAL